MLEGLAEVDWGSLRHAYGSAERVPELLLGLVSADAAEREAALDGLYGAVHHQGDVYEATLACVPFLLEVVAAPAVPDRGAVVELLVSIGGGGFDDLDDGDPLDGVDGVHIDGVDVIGDLGDLADADDADAAGGGAPGRERPPEHAMAEAALRHVGAGFAALAADADPGVRGAVPRALVLFHDDPAQVLRLLADRLALEPEAEVRIAVIAALALLARRRRELAPHVVHELRALLADGRADPLLRLAALTALARCAPAELPADVVPVVRGLLRERRAQPGDEPRVAGPAGAGPGADGPSPEVIAGSPRHVRSPDEGATLLRELHRALGARIGERAALLVDQLRSPATAERTDAVWMAASLLREWRGGHAEVVALVGRQLESGEPGLQSAALSVLQDFFALAAPAADALAAVLADDPGARVRHWADGLPTLGEALTALARCGDPRAVPLLAEALDMPRPPADAGFQIEHLGPEAARQLAPLLHARLAEIRPDTQEGRELVAPVLAGVRAVGDPVVVPKVLELLRRAVAAGDCLAVESALQTLEAFGTAAGEAAGDLRALLDGEAAVRAAAALWAVTGDAGPVLPVLLRELDGQDRFRRLDAVRVVAPLGPDAAASVAPRLRRLLRSDDLWTRAQSAMSLCAVSGATDAALPVLRAAWTDNPYVRAPAAACLAALGPAAAPAADLLRAELAEPRRHRTRAGGWDSHDIDEDLHLLRQCRRALDAAEGPMPVSGPAAPS